MDNAESGVMDSILPCLPQRLRDEIIQVVDRTGDYPEELRIRAERRASLTYGTKNVMLSSALKAEEVNAIVRQFCGNSLYAYKETLAAGYIPQANGIRIGICGSAVTENGKISAVHNITSLSVRVPRRTDNAALPLCRKLRKDNGVYSCMIFAPSGVGKTTVLRSLSRIFAEGPNPLRVAVIDSREEIGAFLGGSGLCIDVLRGYPKETGIEIAARTLNAQLIICDEVFGEEEARALCGAVNCGVPVICSAHAGSLEELLKRKGIEMLHRMRAFDKYVKLSRTDEKFVFGFEIYDREGNFDGN